jgi:hypothetical protein
MKYLNLLKKEIKTKWSTRLFILVLALIACTIYASNVQLKHHYDLSKNAPKDRFKGFKKVFDAPFKHIKIENCVYKTIHFDTISQQQGVYIMDNDEVFYKCAKDISVKNDTLFLKNMDAYDYDFGRFPLHIFASQIESITLIKGNLFLSTLNQKALTINLFDLSHFILSNKMTDLFFCKITMSGKSEINARYSRDNKKDINIQTVEAELQDSCTLRLGVVNIDNFKLKATEGNKIELSSKTLNSMMKK